MIASLSRESFALSAYITAAILLSIGGTAALLAGATGPGATAGFDWPLFLLLTATAAALEWNGTSLFGESRVSLSFVPLFVIALLLGPAPASVAALATIWLAELVRRKPPHKILFNASVVSISTAAGGLFFHAVSGALDIAALHWQLVPAVLAALVTFIVNSVLVAGVVAIASRSSVFQVWDEKFRWLIPHYLTLGLTAFAVAAAYRSLDLLGLAVFALPVAVLRLSMEQYISRARAEVERTKEANAALGESEERLRTVMETAQGGIVVIGPDGRAIFFNNALCLLLGYSRAELRELALGDLLLPPAAAADPPPHYVQRVRTGQGEELELDVRVAPFRQGGETVGSLIELRDVTDERRLQRRVTEAAAELSSILEAAPGGVVLVDAEGLILRANPSTEELFGWPAFDLTGRSMNVLVPELADEPPAAWSSPHAGLGPVLDRFREMEGLRRDGSTFPLEFGVEAIAGGEGSEQRFVLILQDLTDRKIAQRDSELARLATVRSQFLATMSHELRTPLNSIIGFGELLAAEMPDPLTETQHSYVRDIVESSDHLLSLITDVLDLSKVDAGRHELNLVPVDVGELLEDVTRGLQPEASAKGVRLLLLAGDGPPTIQADQRAFRQILLNLLSNAVKFTERGHVEVRASECDGYALIEVADTGIGIPEESLDEIFEEFTRIESGYDRQFPGTGLGLAITRRLVILHGGTIEVSSELGQGSTFRVRLPCEGPTSGRAEALDRSSLSVIPAAE
ncbi:MAG: PAS domain S-box protein [Dehalococcoidia bacterium]